jgi:hypothetical protein
MLNCSGALGFPLNNDVMPERDATNANNDRIWMKPWELLRSGDFDQGLQIMREECETKPGAREKLRLGIGYMWAEMYGSAAAHFIAAAHSPRNSEIDYAFAGVAEWRLGNMAAAIQLWREGLKAQYAVGCMVCSMTARFLVVASALEPDRFSKQEAESILLDATGRIDPSRWSGVLGRFLLGQIERSEVERWIENRDQDVKVALLWKTDFYSAARGLNRAEIDALAFRSLMRPLADAVNSEAMDVDTFAKLLRKPEYFFARTEAAKSC